ncbi:MAG: adenylate/guanylate cyclase domain-containing protein [bacterium]|nr:adenylate/guanylate cyclase domain-containing protein [bacterium]
MIERAGQRFAAIGIVDADDEDERLQKTLLVASSAMISASAVVWGLVYLALGQPLSASIPLSYAVLSTLSVALFARLRRYKLFRRSQLGLTLLLPFLLSLSLGGLVASSGVVLWSLTCPLGALVFSGYKEARAWFLAFVVIVGASFLLEPVVSNRAGLSDFVVVVFMVMNIAAVSTIAFVLLQYFTSQREAAQETSEALLLNILPRSIAQVLKQGPKTIAEHYEGASVLFADVVDFTPMSADMSPEDLVELLNDVFTYFDQVADELGIEKIKTIGDCYMAASGVPERRDDHAHVLTDMALRVRRHVDTHDFLGRSLEFRIGINSGPLVAGVIGTRKFIYDLWGDAVNTASRMESQGERGMIQITRATYELIKDDYVCEPKGRVRVKGKGEMDVWHVTGARVSEPVS